MPDLEIETRTGARATLPRAAVQALRAALRGPLLEADHAGYDDARALWNAMFDRRPALIARCAGASDVLAAVRFAREHDVLVAVRGGGHHIAGTSVCDGGLTIDLSPMRSVRVDPENRTARVEPGALWADVDRETQAFGLAVPGGVVSTTGVAGLTLGGGFGRLSRAYGLTSDNLLGADVVTADGRLIHASGETHQDLFWGLRGGGGNFGVVTSLEFRLHEAGPTVLFGPVAYRLEDALDVLEHYAAWALTAPRRASIWADLLTAPPLPFLPDDAHGAKLLFVVPFYAGDLDEGERLLEPLRTFGRPVGDAVARVPYADTQQAIDPLYAAGAHNYWKAHNFAQLPRRTLETIVSFAGSLPTPQSDILISHLGGAINDPAFDATAYPHREAQFSISPGARWAGPEGNEPAVQWTRDLCAAIEADALGGSYVNFIAERAGRERDAYGRNLERLGALKQRYDPTNLFRSNQSLCPS